MTDRELMQRALDALNRSYYLGWQLNIPIIKALRERLAQPEQEPVAWRELLCEARDNCKASIVEEGISAIRKEYRIDLEARLTAALNTPPQSRREWVELTDEEIDEVTINCFGPNADLEFHRFYAQAIEAKRREKNT